MEKCIKLNGSNNSLWKIKEANTTENLMIEIIFRDAWNGINIKKGY